MPTERADIFTKLRRIRYSIASTGVRRGLADVATLLLAYSPERDDSFDREFGTDTAGSVSPSELGIADAAVRESAILYLPSPARVTRWMLDNVGIEHRDFWFVDLGCGKGRVLLVAAEYPFRQIVGVEISAALSEIARKNAAIAPPRSRRCRDIEIQNADATTFDIPRGNILLHLYHPFEPTLTSASAVAPRAVVQGQSPSDRRRLSALRRGGGGGPGGVLALSLAQADALRTVGAGPVQLALLLELIEVSERSREPGRA